MQKSPWDIKLVNSEKKPRRKVQSNDYLVNYFDSQETANFQREFEQICGIITHFLVYEYGALQVEYHFQLRENVKYAPDDGLFIRFFLNSSQFTFPLHAHHFANLSCRNESCSRNRIALHIQQDKIKNSKCTSIRAARLCNRAGTHAQWQSFHFSFFFEK